MSCKFENWGSRGKGFIIIFFFLKLLDSAQQLFCQRCWYMLLLHSFQAAFFFSLHESSVFSFFLTMIHKLTEEKLVQLKANATDWE